MSYDLMGGCPTFVTGPIKRALNAAIEKGQYNYACGAYRVDFQLT